MHPGALFCLNPQEEHLAAPLHPRLRPWVVFRALVLFFDLYKWPLEQIWGNLGLAWYHPGSYLTLIDRMSYAMASFL